MFAGCVSDCEARRGQRGQASVGVEHLRRLVLPVPRPASSLFPIRQQLLICITCFSFSSSFSCSFPSLETHASDLTPGNHSSFAVYQNIYCLTGVICNESEPL